MPSIGREQYYAGKSVTFSEKQERSLLKRFRRYAYEYFRHVPTEWETLFLARHHGLPTRLLDWTANPLVALYFAASHESDDLARSAPGGRERKLEVDGTVWAIARRQTDRDSIDVVRRGTVPARRFRYSRGLSSQPVASNHRAIGSFHLARRSVGRPREMRRQTLRGRRVGHSNVCNAGPSPPRTKRTSSSISSESPSTAARSFPTSMAWREACGKRK